jgi:hypothetical protein
VSKVIERVKLFYREGKSDKIYVIELIEEDEGQYSVVGYNGRRGARLVPQPKTPVPVSLNTARHIFNNLEQSKLNHRQTPYQIAERSSPSTNPLPANEKPTLSPDKVEESRGGKSEDLYEPSFLDALEI